MRKEIKLFSVRPGEHFILDGVEFVKLADDCDASFAVTADVLDAPAAFEVFESKRDSKNDFLRSSLYKIISSWASDHPDIFQAAVSRGIDLTTMDGMTDYGKPTVISRSLTIDEYRRYRKLIPLTSRPYWLATGASAPNSPDHNTRFACCVNALGAMNYSVVYRENGYCPRPAFYLNSGTLVSVDGESDALCDKIAVAIMLNEFVTGFSKAAESLLERMEEGGR